MFCGIDTVDVTRFRAWYERASTEQLATIFAQDEFDYCHQCADPLPHLAARFAVKEACLKCFPKQTAMHDLAFSDFTVAHDNYGAPFIVMTEKLRNVLAINQLNHVVISLSHTAEQAVAMAIVS